MHLKTDNLLTGQTAGQSSYGCDSMLDSILEAVKKATKRRREGDLGAECGQYCL